MRILVVNPALIRLNALGACEQDRLLNVQHLTALGHTIKLLTGYMPYQKPDDVAAYYAQRDLEAQLVPIGTQRWHPKRFSHLAYVDGMAWEYAQPKVITALDKLLHDFQPDVVWCHGSYLWAVAQHAQKRHFRTVVRSVNYEPTQLLHEDGNNFANHIRVVGKQAGERYAAQANVLVAITPAESQIYQAINPSGVVKVLPLRALPRFLQPAHPARDMFPLHVFFMSATYNVSHNLAALQFIVQKVVPRVRQLAPHQFVFHLMGSKVPQAMLALAAEDVVFDGYVPDIDQHLAHMDIALAPSLFGVGMQQKVFEPLARAFPTITHERVLAGYPFESGRDLLTASTADEYAAHLVAMLDPALRASLSQNAAERAQQLFSQATYDQLTQDILAVAVR